MKNENKERLNYMYKLLCRRVYTIEELENIFEIRNRQVRVMISTLAKKVPLISTSDSSGYFIATKREHLESVQHQLRENDKRAAEILERNSALKEFLDKNFTEVEQLYKFVSK